MNKYAEILNQIISTASAKIRDLDETDLSHKESPKKWSKKEILGHLIDSAYNNHQRIVRTNKQGDMIFQGYDQDDWVVKNNYQKREAAEVLTTWVIIQNHFRIAVESIPDSLLNLKTNKHNFHEISMNKIAEGQQSSLAYLIWDYTYHLEHHLAQIIPEYKRINRPYEL